MLAVTTGSEHAGRAQGAHNLTRAMKSLEAIFLIGVEGVTEIWLVRHADCYQDMEEAVDPPLSALGRAQASLLAERVRHVDPAAVYSSPLRRAMETAEAITADVHIDDRLVEMALEVFEDGTLDFKETHDAAVSRMRSVLDDLVGQHDGQRVVVVTHAASIIACLTDVMRLRPGELRLLPYYTSISVVRALGDRRMAGSLCDIAHLE